MVSEQLFAFTAKLAKFPVNQPGPFMAMCLLVVLTITLVYFSKDIIFPSKDS